MIGQLDFGWLYYPLIVIGIVGFVNAVNITDGIDGLASSVTFVAAIGFMMISSVLDFGGICILSTALAGSCLGFLVWNFYPAKVFMGDVGSMFLGGMVVAPVSYTHLDLYKRQVWTVFISPADIEDDEERETICSGLSEILGVDRETIYQKSQKSNYYEVIARKIDKDKADEVRQFVTDTGVGAVHLIEDTKRSYPYGNFASTVIGFTGDDNQGLYGIEAEYDEELSGTPGRIVAAKNAKGTDMPLSLIHI